jgi:AraC family transcriptional activator FtrA
MTKLNLSRRSVVGGLAATGVALTSKSGAAQGAPVKVGELNSYSRMAAFAALSLRALHRRFLETMGASPGDWLTRERVARAQELLETTGLSIEDVAAASGFGSAATLRHHFRSGLGTSPAAYRERFGRAAA